MAGYKGYSMSNNAVAAYEGGKKPLSKWTKAAILEDLERQAEAGEIPESLTQEAAGLKAADLKTFLKYSEWHHTGSHYNRTPFYQVDTDSLLARFGYRLAVQVTTPDGTKTGTWTDRNPSGFGYMSFLADEGVKYPRESISNAAAVYVKRGEACPTT